MGPELLFSNLKEKSLAAGFNLVGRVRTKDYSENAKSEKRVESIYQDAKSIILVGFAGNKYWDILKGFLENHQPFETANEDWIDEYTILKFNLLAEILEKKNVNHKIVFPFRSSATIMDFMLLGRLAGFGVPSLLGILLHPEYGSWISLRGAIITDIEFSSYDKPLSGFDPCPPCSKPCITACPANTVSLNGWDWNKCMNFRLDSPTCESNCFSRRACPYGIEHQYSEEQLAHHHKFVIKGVKRYWKKET